MTGKSLSGREQFDRKRIGLCFLTKMAISGSRYDHILAAALDCRLMPGVQEMSKFVGDRKPAPLWI